MERPDAPLDQSICNRFGSRLIVDQMPNNGPFQNVQLHVYPGGHMFYPRPDSVPPVPARCHGDLLRSLIWIAKRKELKHPPFLSGEGIS